MFNKKLKQELSVAMAELSSLKGLLVAFDKSMAIIEFDRDAKIIAVNDEFIRVMGYKRDEIIGRVHLDMCPATLTQGIKYNLLWKELRAGHCVSGTYPRMDKQGHTIWFDAIYNPVLDDKGIVTKIVKYATDVSERIKKEAEARATLAALNKTMAIVEFDPLGRILFANGHFLHTLGYELPDVIGQYHQMLCAPGYAQTLEYKDFWRRLGKGEFIAGHFKCVDRKGKAVWLDASYNPIYGADGKLIKIAKFSINTAERIGMSNVNYFG